MLHWLFWMQRIHVSWLVVWLSVGLIAGIVSALWWSLSWSIWLWCFLVACAVGLLWLGRRLAIPLLLVCGVLIGLMRGSATIVAERSFETYVGQNVGLTGRVFEDPSRLQSGELRLRLDNVTIDTLLHGHVWLSTNDSRDIKRGDIVTVEGKLGQGFGRLAASMWRAKVVEVVRVQHADIGRELRDSFADGGIRTAIPEPQASLGSGYLTGQRSSLPEDLEEKMRLLGLTHVVVASGYNLTILVRFARRLFAKRSKYLACSVAFALIAVFVLVTGLSPSMTRAALVAGLSLLAWYVGRSAHPVVILAFAAAVTAYAQPGYVWGDLGWYLSFLSFAGVLLLAPMLKELITRRFGKESTVLQLMLETTAAQLLTLPLIVAVFGLYSPYALLANLLILPLVPLAMLLTFVAGIGALMLPGIASAIGLPATGLLSYMTAAVDWLAVWPGASWELSGGAAWIVAGYAIMLCAGLLLWQRLRFDFRQTNIVL